MEAFPLGKAFNYPGAKEIPMLSDLGRKTILVAMATLGWIAGGGAAKAQTVENYGAPQTSASKDDVKALATLVRQLQSQVEKLSDRVKTLEANEKSALAESDSLRAELTRAQQSGSAERKGGAAGAPEPTSESTSAFAPRAADPQQETEERMGRLEEDLSLTNAKVEEQSQTKVESSSKYRVRLSGLALFNLFTNRGTVDNEDIPQIATPPGPLDSAGTFGGTLRQSQIGLDAFGPDVAGARTSAEIRFDFAGGFTRGPNGDNMGFARLRTGTVRFDWDDTSLVAGQDYLFFSPLTPTSFATLAIPALSYSGNLWGWTPQIRVEHRFQVSEGTVVTVAGGILEGLSGDYPDDGYARMPTHAEQSGQPAYAARVAWSHDAFGQKIVAGAGGYYGRQYFGFGRNVDGWAGTADLTVPLGRFVEFAGQFYRGRAVGGLGGGIGQDALWNGLLANPATEVYGLDSIGGWVQLKVKPTAKFEINGAVGDDNPFSSELREFAGNPLYSGRLLSKNLTPFVNFIYRPRSDLLFSLEYRHLKTYTLDSYANTANHINLSVGYIF
jgi:hypothetical protein